MGRNHIYSMAHTSTPCGKGLQFLQDALQGSENRKHFFCFLICVKTQNTQTASPTPKTAQKQFLPSQTAGRRESQKMDCWLCAACWSAQNPQQVAECYIYTGDQGEEQECTFHTWLQSHKRCCQNFVCLFYTRQIFPKVSWASSSHRQHSSHALRHPLCGEPVTVTTSISST